MGRDSQNVMLKQLKQPFDPRFVKWRVGATNSDKTKGIALAYVDSREVMKRFDEVCGLGGWQSNYDSLDKGFICSIAVKIDDEWIVKSNSAGYTNVEPIKGGASDAFKRAASTWGVGRYLYYLPTVWMPIKPFGKSYVLAEIPELPDWAKPDADVERWEDVAELELDATASADEQQIAGEVISKLNEIRDAQDVDALTRIMDNLTQEEQAIYASQINSRTKEILGGSDTKTDTDKS